MARDNAAADEDVVHVDLAVALATVVATSAHRRVHNVWTPLTPAQALLPRLRRAAGQHARPRRRGSLAQS